MSSFTDQKPHLVTKEHLSAPWGGKRDGSNFRCGLCGYRFKEGDTFRWMFTNNTKAFGNPFVCQDCDGPDALDRWKGMHKLMRTRYWWFSRHVQEPVSE